ncbi:3-keto-disaccharide hydrolase [Planctomicrobium sp. SH661]|uniref:3-keto-disaccharide hydrolase n=1 Tax=Planctomicrobium sp. SH661 TaxID=3448124 RepID=UPI003F5AFFC4
MKFRDTLAVCLICTAATSAYAADGWKDLFDGKTIDGWKVLGGTATYRVEDGMIIGKTTEGSPNTFLCKGPFSDFELELDVLCDKELNSGIQIRSQIQPEDVSTLPEKDRGRKPGTVYGYQCEIATADSHVSGNFWDESRAGKWWDDFKDRPEAQTAFKDDQWNHYRIVAQGDRLRSWINGIPCADFRDDTDASGIIGLQVHGIKSGTGPYQVRWKNVRIRELKPGEVVE